VARELRDHANACARLTRSYSSVVSAWVDLDDLKESAAKTSLATAEGKGNVTIAQPDSLRDCFVAVIPHLRAFALSLCHDSQRAHDLVQEALAKGWQKRHSFEQGTNLKAWLFTILRNIYFSELRKVNPVEANSNCIEGVGESPAQPGYLDLQDLAVRLGRLEPDQREALILVGAEGFSYEEAAQICGCAVGTIKSRVNRARNRLAKLLHVSAWEELGPARQAAAD
jgi:RNA polymerase sigma-70 factor (ECF subfamily)